MFEPKKKKFIVELDSNWVLQHRNDDELPIAAMKAELSKDKTLIIKESSLTSMTIIYTEDTADYSGIKGALVRFFKNRYPEDKPNEIMSFKSGIADDEDQPDNKPEKSETDEETREKIERENAELNTTIESEKALQINYTYDDIRKWLQHFRTLDYTKTKNRKTLIDTFIYRVVLYDDKMKVLFNLKSGQKNELLLNLIFPDYPEGSGCVDENSAKEKETENSVSQSGCSYTPDMVHRLTAKTNTIIYKVNRRELYCAVELPLSDYKLFGKQLAAR